jgi:hypothetical protein
MKLLLAAATLGLVVGFVAALLHRGSIVAFLSAWAAFLVSLSLLGIPPVGLLASPGGLMILAIVGLVYLGPSLWAMRARELND